MIAGEPYLKGYRLPWEQQILADRIWNAEYGIYTTSAEMELLLLLTRAALKFRTRMMVFRRFSSHVHGEGLRREFTWLLDRVDTDRFERLANAILPPKIVALMLAVVREEKLDSQSFLDLRRRLLNYLSDWRTYAPWHANLLRWQREFNRRLLQPLSRRVGLLPVARRTPACGGAIVALIGADGSGKSTQAKLLLKWLGWKIDVTRIYFGSGDGPMSWHRGMLLQLQKLFGGSGRGDVSSRVNDVPSDKSAPVVKTTSSLRRSFKALYAISLAIEKHGAIVKATRARNRGMVVICDRYPQNQIAGYNDGPLLSEWFEDDFPWRNIARLEKRILSVFSSVRPDLVIKLHVSEGVSFARKADTPKEMIAKKIAAVRSLEFGPECQVAEIDAEQPLDVVTLDIRRRVWRFL